MRPRLYLAGSLHREGMRQHLEMLAAVMDEYYEVYVPHRDGGLYSQMLREGRPYEEAADAVRDADLDAIGRADVMLVVAMEKYVHDPGVCFEIGYASAVGVPVAVYGPDLDAGPALNPMIQASVAVVLRHVSDLAHPILPNPTQESPT